MSLDGRVSDRRGRLRRNERCCPASCSDLGVETAEASDGHEALDRLASQQIDLVVTDLRMPRMGGAELLREVKKLNPDIGVVLVTAFGTVQSAVEIPQSRGHQLPAEAPRPGRGGTRDPPLSRRAPAAA